MSKTRQIQRNYLRKLAEAAQLQTTNPKGVTHAIIQHDDWCPMLNGGDACTCNPVVRLMSDKDYRRMASAKRN